MVVAEYAGMGAPGGHRKRIANVCTAEIENRCRRQYFTHSPCRPSQRFGKHGRACWSRRNDAKKNWGECTLVVVEWAHQRVTECIAIVCAAETENRCRRQYFTHSPCQPSRGLGQLERARWGVQQRGAIERSACTRVHCCTYIVLTITRHRCARNTVTSPPKRRLFGCYTFESGTRAALVISPVIYHCLNYITVELPTVNRPD